MVKPEIGQKKPVTIEAESKRDSGVCMSLSAWMMGGILISSKSRDPTEFFFSWQVGGLECLKSLEAFPAVPVYSTNRCSIDASDWLIVTNEENIPTIPKAKRQRRLRGVRD